MAEVSNHAASRLAGIARQQEGIVTTHQLRAAGLHDEAISRWVTSRRIRPVFRGVFVMGAAQISAQARMRAAALACPGSVISHRSAAALLGIGKTAPAVVDLIPAVERGRKIDGIKAHRVPFPTQHEWGYLRGIPVTGVARTILDLAGVYGEKEMQEAVERAATKRVLDVARIDAILANGPKRRGAPCLRRVLKDWRPVAETARYATFRSLFEAKLLPLVAAADLPLPRFNVPIQTAERILEVDLFWDDARFVVEADSRRHHGIEIAFKRDHRRTRELLAADYGVLRVTWHEAEVEAPAVFAVIRQELAKRGVGAATNRGPTLPT